MALTIGNIALTLALVIVSVLLGTRISRKRWYKKGVEDGIALGEEIAKTMFNALEEIYDFVPKSEPNAKKAE